MSKPDIVITETVGNSSVKTEFKHFKDYLLYQGIVEQVQDMMEEEWFEQGETH